MDRKRELTISPQILNHPQTSLLIRHRRIQIVLLALGINTKALEVNIPSRTKLRLHRSGDIDRTLHRQFLHAALHDGEIDGDDTCHFNRAAE